MKAILLAIPLILSGCHLSQIGYHRTLRQGVPINDQDVAQLKIGQSRSAVESILGTPILVAPNDGPQWVYLHQFSSTQHQSSRQVLLTFNGDALASIQTVPAQVPHQSLPKKLG